MLNLLLTISLAVAIVAQPITINRFANFMVTYLGHYMKYPCAKMHHEWMTALCDKSVKRLYIEAGRGGAKTTYASIGYSLFELCEGTDEEMQVASRASGATGTSTKIMRRVKRELEENALLRHDYGIQKGADWGKEALEVRRGIDNHRMMFYSIGKHSSIRGSRGTVIIDDPQNKADCRSATVLEADEDWLLEDVLPVVIDEQRLIFIGTPISPLSLLSIVKSLPSFRGYSFPLANPEEPTKSLWPEGRSDEYLAAQLADMGLDNYLAEYCCRPKVPGNPVIKREWLRHYDPNSAQFEELRRNFTYTVLGGDAAESKADAADYTFLVTLSQTPGDKPDYYVRDVRRGHWSTKEGAEQIFMVFDELQQHKTIVESRVSPKAEQLGDAFIEEIRHREQIYGKYVNLYPVRPVQDKVQRLRYVQSLFQEGRVFFDFHNKNHQILIGELTMFTGDQQFHDDGVDAIGHALRDMKDHGGTGAGIEIRSGLEGAWQT